MHTKEIYNYLSAYNTYVVNYGKTIKATMLLYDICLENGNLTFSKDIYTKNFAFRELLPKMICDSECHFTNFNGKITNINAENDILTIKYDTGYIIEFTCYNDKWRELNNEECSFDITLDNLANKKLFDDKQNTSYEMTDYYVVDQFKLGKLSYQQKADMAELLFPQMTNLRHISTELYFAYNWENDKVCYGIWDALNQQPIQNECHYLSNYDPISIYIKDLSEEKRNNELNSFLSRMNCI